MADIDDRWFRTDKATGAKVPTGRYGSGRRWNVRWRDDTGTQRHKAFERKADAERFLAKVTTDLAGGTYLDPAAGKVTLQAYAERWLAAQTFDVTTREASRCGCGCMYFRSSAATGSGRCAQASCRYGPAGCSSSWPTAKFGSCSPTFQPSCRRPSTTL